MTTGAEAIATERRRQIEEEGWTPEHDDQFQKGELAKAAICYAWWGSFARFRGEHIPGDWWLPASWWKPKDRRANLVRAGALIAAEIDRLDRARTANRNIGDAA